MRMHRRLLLFALAVALWGLLPAAWAARMVLVLPEGDSGHTEAADALVQELVRAGAARSDVQRLGLAEAASASAIDGAGTQIIITLGAEALRTTLQRNPGAAVLASLIPRAAFDKVVGEAGLRGGPPVHAVFLDQPAGRQLDLVRLALPEVDRVGVLWSRDSQGLHTALQAAARPRGLQLVSSRVAARGEEKAPLAQVLTDAQVLLAVPDPQIYHSASIANLLLATYRASVPLVGFSPSYVRAGALMALYSTPRQIGEQTAQRAWALLAAPSPTATVAYPADFTVEVNAYVARSLGRNLNAAEVSEKLHALERRP